MSSRSAAKLHPWLKIPRALCTAPKTYVCLLLELLGSAVVFLCNSRLQLPAPDGSSPQSASQTTLIQSNTTAPQASRCKYTFSIDPAAAARNPCQALPAVVLEELHRLRCNRVFFGVAGGGLSVVYAAD